MSEPPQYPVIVDPQAFAAMSREERLVREREATDAIVNRMPKEHQAEARSFFEHGQPGCDISFVSSEDPEVARLLGIITSIRQQNWRETGRLT